MPGYLVGKMMNRMRTTIIRWILGISLRLEKVTRLVPYRLRHAAGLMLYRSAPHKLSNGEKCYQNFDRFEITPHRILVSGWFVCRVALDEITLKVDGRDYPCEFDCGFCRPEIGGLYPNFKNCDQAGFTMRCEFSPPLSVASHLIEISLISNGSALILKKNIQVIDHYARYLDARRQMIARGGNRKAEMKTPGSSELTVLFFTGSLEPARCQPVWDALTRRPWAGCQLIVVRDPGARGWNEFRESSFQPSPPCVVTDHENLGAVLNQIDARWLALVGPQSQPWPGCLSEVQDVWRNNPDCLLIYGDEDCSLLDGGDRHFFKPDFSDELLLSTNYIGDFFFIHKGLYHDVGGIRNLAIPDAFHDLLLRASEATRSVVHIPDILSSVTGRAMPNLETGQRIVEEALSRRNIQAYVTPCPDMEQTVWEIRPRITARAKVSIIILTACRDEDHNLGPCLKSIAERSTYDNYEIVLVDNSQGRLIHSKILDQLPDQLGVTVIDNHDPFNFPKMNNLAAAKARGQYLVLLNDDIEIRTPDWMEQMMGLAAAPGVGVVGCKLLFPDRTLQHAGVVILPTGPVHPCRFAPGDDPGYNGLLAGLRNWSSVTFACAMIPAETYASLGGMSESFAVEFNDVDFCLRASEKGYRTVYTPMVEQIHKESATRRFTEQVGVCGDLESFRKKWPGIIGNGDPFFNPHLSLTCEFFTFNPK